jgi:hypothetical protein
LKEEKKKEYKIYSDDEKEEIDVKNIGKIKLSKKEGEYLPEMNKNIRFNSRTFNPLLITPRAPNKRLE